MRPLYYGRAPGIKGWLRENVPALALRYTTVMCYKVAAKKLRQVVELPDPIPVAAVLDGDGAGEGRACWTGQARRYWRGRRGQNRNEIIVRKTEGRHMWRDRGTETRCESASPSSSCGKDANRRAAAVPTCREDA